MSLEQIFSAQDVYLSILTATPAQEIKQLVKALLACLPNVQVINSRTGLAMLPFTDSATGVTFYLGETLLAEARVRVGEEEGYAACLGRDLDKRLH